MELTIICGGCKSQLQDDWNFCPVCGKHIRPCSDKVTEEQLVSRRLELIRSSHAEVGDGEEVTTS